MTSGCLCSGALSTDFNSFCADEYTANFEDPPSWWALLSAIDWGDWVVWVREDIANSKSPSLGTNMAGINVEI